MFCTQCGKKISDDARFCPHCGSPTGGAPAAGGTQDNSTESRAVTGTAGSILQDADASEPSSEAPAPNEAATGPNAADAATFQAAGTSAEPASATQPGTGADVSSSQTGTISAPTISQASAEPSPDTTTGSIGAQVAEARKSAKRKMPLFLLVVLVALGIATTAFAATVVWRYVIAPAIEAAQTEPVEASTDNSAEEGEASTAAATTEDAAASEHRQTQTSGALQQYGDTLYLSGSSQGDLSIAFSGNVSTLPVDTTAFVIYDDRIYYAAQPDTEGSDFEGTVSSYTGGGIYSCNLDGSDSKLLCSDNAYSSDFSGTSAVADEFYISDGKLCYTALEGDARGSLFPIDATAYKVAAIDLGTGSTTTLADGKLLSGSDGKLAIKQVRESWAEGEISTSTYYNYSYSLIDAETGGQLCSLDEVLPKETAGARYKVEYDWYVYVMDNTLLCVEGVEGNGSAQSDIPIVKASIAEDGTIASTETATSSTAVPFNDSIVANYAERTVSFTVEEAYLEGGTTKFAKSLVTIHADDLSISTESLD